MTGTWLQQPRKVDSWTGQKQHHDHVEERLKSQSPLNPGQGHPNNGGCATTTGTTDGPRTPMDRVPTSTHRANTGTTFMERAEQIKKKKTNQIACRWRQTYKEPPEEETVVE